MPNNSDNLKFQARTLAAIEDYLTNYQPGGLFSRLTSEHINARDDTCRIIFEHLFAQEKDDKDDSSS